eukprot:4030110-Pyramimonas_sp.AAC.1
MICVLSRPAIWYAASVVSAGATGERPVRPSLCRSQTCWSTSAGWGAAVGSSGVNPAGRGRGLRVRPPSALAGLDA